jgi:hypothetical protein
MPALKIGFMKRLYISLLLLVAVFLCGCQSTGRGKQSAESRPLRVAYVSGDAIVSAASGKRKLEVGEVLKEGDSIRTGTNGVVDFEWSPLYAVRIRPDSEFTLNRATKVANSKEYYFTQLEVRRGSVVCDVSVRKMSKDSKFEVRSLGTILGVRGESETAFRFYSDGCVTVAKGEIINNIPVGLMSLATLHAGQSLDPPIVPGGVPVFPTPKETASNLAKELRELRKHCPLR